MPRPFTQIERENIRKDLIRAVSDIIIEKGYKKTSIDQIAQRSHISKGAFYLFYKSKESLVFDAIRFVQNNAREALLNSIKIHNEEPKEIVSKVISSIFNVFEDYPFLKEISKPDIMIELSRTLSGELTDEYNYDDNFFEEFFKKLIENNIIKPIDTEILAGLPRIIYSLILNKEMIGKNRFNDISKMLISGLSNELACASRDQNHLGKTL